MKLKINSMYKTDDGFIIPMSHLMGEKGVKYGVFRLLIGTNPVVIKHTTLSTKELKEIMHTKERVEIC